RRKTRECAEHCGENLAALEPALAAEQEHADEGQNGIGEGKPGDEVWDGRIRVDELDPRERQEKNERGPDPERLRLRHARAERGPSGEPAVDGLDRFEDRPPRIDRRPEIANERANIGEPDPGDGPYHRRCDVAVGVLVAAKPRDDRDDEAGEREELER